MSTSPSAPDALPTTRLDLGDGTPVDALDEAAVCAEVERRLFGHTDLGSTIGRYRVIEAIGGGSFGVVYRAEDPELGRTVALKVLRRRAELTDASTATLLSEARAMAKLAHPNVVHVYDAGIADGRVFVAMELVEGMTLRTWLEAAPRTWSDVLAVVVRAGAGLAAAHAAGLLHRDFKPDNVLVERGPRPRVRVTDFGLALAVRDADSTVEDGFVMGTPAYMAPEQTSGGAIDPRADQFAFCVTLWEALHGKRPFEIRALSDIMTAIAEGPRPAAHRAAPRWLEGMLRRGLSASPTDRFPSMDALLTAIERAQGLRRRLVLAAGFVLMAGATGAVAYYTGAEQADDPCRIAAARVEQVWDDARASAIRDAFMGTDVAFADTAATTVVGTLDAWADAWRDGYRDACARRRVRQDAAPRIEAELACLDERLDALSLMVTELARVDAAAVERAPGIVGGIEPPTSCPHTDNPPPGAERAAILRTELARVQPLRLTGELDEALAIAREVAADPAASDDPALQASALYEVGDLTDRLGRGPEAVEPLTTAYWNAEAAGDDALAVKIASALVYIVGAELAQLDNARRWGDHAKAKLRRLDEPARLRATLLHNEATVDVVDGEFERALAAQQESIEVLRGSSSDDALADELQLAASLDNRGAILVLLGRHDEARRDHEQALEIGRRRKGALHPDTAATWGNLGNVAHAAGDFETAREHFERAAEIFAAAPIARPSELARCHNNLGNVLMALGRPREAVAEHERALALFRELFGATHPEVAMSLDNLGSALLDAGDPRTAVDHHRTALAIRSEAFGDGHYAVAYSHHGLGRALAAVGEWDEAVEHLQTAVELRGDGEGVSNEELAQTLFDLARVLDERPEGAARAIEAAQTGLSALSDPQNEPGRKLRDELRTWLQQHDTGAGER